MLASRLPPRASSGYSRFRPTTIANAVTSHAVRIPRPGPSPNVRLYTRTTPVRLSWRQRSGQRYDPRAEHRSPEEHLRTAQPLFPLRILRRASAWIDRVTHRVSTRSIAIWASAAGVVFYAANSQTVPVSGRRRFNFFGESWLAKMGANEAEAILADLQEEGRRVLPEWDPRTAMVKKVMERLVPVSGMAHLDWKIHVIDDDNTINAFVTPGGHLFVFTGMFNVTGSKDALAAVLGHEIAHNVAEHAAERLSSAVAGNIMSGSLFMLAGLQLGLALWAVWIMSGGYYLQQILYSLPMGRRQEGEADYIGLMMMAEACFNPKAAVGYWQRMNQLSQQGGAEVPEMLSTHPSNHSRVEKIKQWLPEAIEKRSQSDCRGTGAWAKDFRKTILDRQLIRI